MEPQMNPQMPPPQAPEQAGQGTDTVLGHLSLGEVVIPRAFLDDPDVMQMLQALFQQNGADLGEFTVGDPANKINPETGYPEFFSFGKILRAVAPLALSYFAPGLGTALGSSILGAGAVGASTLGNALIGGGLGALTGGGLKGALLGAAGGGIGANLGELGSGLQGPLQSGATLDSGGSGILGAVRDATGLTSGNIQSIGGLVGGSGGGSSSFGLGSALTSAFGGVNQDAAIKKQKQQLLGANQQQLANLETFDPSGITEDPGYKFNLEQGQQGLNRTLGAQGNLFSGKALKAASAYNQDYANNAFKDYYQRWLTKTGAQNQLIGTGGDISANATGAGSQNLAQSLSNVFGSKVGAYGDPNAALLALLKRTGTTAGAYG